MTEQPQYRLIKVNQIRCGEDRAYTFILAPVDWDYDEIYSRLSKAQESYLKDIEEAKKGLGPKPPSPYTQVKLEDHIGKTVQELIDQRAAERAAYDAWLERDSTMQHKRFTRYLMDQGFVSIWDTQLAEFDVNWGHRHGTQILYDDDDLDTTLPPIKVDEPEEEDG